MTSCFSIIESRGKCKLNLERYKIVFKKKMTRAKPCIWWLFPPYILLQFNILTVFVQFYNSQQSHSTSSTVRSIDHDLLEWNQSVHWLPYSHWLLHVTWYSTNNLWHTWYHDFEMGRQCSKVIYIKKKNPDKIMVHMHCNNKTIIDWILRQQLYCLTLERLK